MKNRFVGNSIFLILSRILPQALNLLFLAILADALSLEEFGKFTVLNSIVLLGNAFTTMGVDVALIRDLRPGTQNQLIPASFWIQTFASLIWIFFCIFTAAFTHAGPELPLIHLSLFPMAWMTVCGGVYRAYQRMDLMIWRNLSSLVFLTGLAPVLYLFPANVFSATCLFVAAHFGAAFLTSVFLPSAGARFTFSWRPVWANIKAMWRSSWRLALFNPIGVLTLRTGIFGVALGAGNAAAGWFSTSLRIIEALKTFHFSTTNSLMPAIAREAEGQRSPKTGFFAITLLWSILAVVVIRAFGLPLLTFIFGPNYAGAYPLLLVMSWSLIPHTVTVFCTMLLVMKGRESEALKANLAGLASALVFYTALILKSGLAGAAAAFVLTESFLAAWIGAIVFLHRERVRLHD